MAKPIRKTINALGRLVGLRKRALEADDILPSIFAAEERLKDVDKGLKEEQRDGLRINNRQKEIRTQIEQLQAEDELLIKEEEKNAADAKKLDENRKQINELIADLWELHEEYESKEGL